MTLKFYASVTKGLKLKDRKFWNYGGKLVESYFVSSPFSIGLKIFISSNHNPRIELKA